MPAHRIQRRRIILLVLGGLAFWGLAPGAAAQKGSSRKPCFRCKGTGKIQVEPPAIERGVLRCSHYARTDETRGVGFRICERCKDPEAKFEYEDRLAVIQKWLGECEDFERAAGIEKGVLLETDRLRLFFAVPSIVVKRRRYDMHRAAHDYLDLLEKTYKEYLEIFGLESEPAKPKHEIFILDDRASFSRFIKTYRGASGTNISGMKFRGSLLWFVTWRDPSTAGRDDRLREKVVHNFAHLLIFKYHRPRADLPTWLDTGFANYLEREYSGGNRNTCFIEVPPPGSFKEGHAWRSRVKKEAGARKQLAFVEFYDKDLNAYDYRDMAYAYSYVDFLIHDDLTKFRALVDRIKEGEGTLDAVREVYGWLPPELDDAWRSYVLKRY